ncbi:unnamed protein product [Linum tenue]|uniref:Uncharacterized protein n=1 Tax=Linum tenue TaxID=586396 RepID=A0AAV0KV31_9ROSI|nr:unnamed protein product [Linum tenue]
MATTNSSSSSKAEPAGSAASWPGKICESQGIDYTYDSGRLENRTFLENDIATIKPTHVFNAAGVTDRPNVEWCESHKVETITTNVVASAL